MKETIKKKLIDAAYAVIKSENLPIPKKIWIRTSLKGTIKTIGTCKHWKTIGDFKIIVNTTKARWFEDEDGIYFDKKGNKYRRAGFGVERNDEEVIETLAHEIAHLKFWNHGPQHISYTKEILKKIEEKIKPLYLSS